MQPYQEDEKRDSGQAGTMPAETQKPEQTLKEPVQGSVTYRSEGQNNLQQQMGKMQMNGQESVQNRPVRRNVGDTRQQMRGTVPPGRRMQSREAMCGHQIQKAAKKCFRSPLFFLIAFINLIFMASSVVGIFMDEISFSQMFLIVERLDLSIEAMDYMDKIMKMISEIDHGMLALNLLIKIPGVILCAGLFLLFFSAFSKEEQMPQTGFILVKIVLVLKTVVTGIIMAVLLVVSVALATSAWIGGDQKSKIAAILLLVVMILVTILSMMFFFCLLHTLKVCRKAAVFAEDYGMVSGYAAFVTVFLAAITGLELLSAIVNLEYAGITCYGAKIVGLLLTVIWTLRYRSKTDLE